MLEERTSKATVARARPRMPVKDLRTLPGDDGTPLVGHTLEFVRDAVGFVDRMSAKHGPNFHAKLFGYPILHVGHPDAVRDVLVDRHQNFSSFLGWQHAIGELFADGLMLRDFEEHRGHRRIMQTAFRSEAMRGYLELMNPLIARGLEAWEREVSAAPFLFYPRIKELTLGLAAEVFLGVPLGAEADRLNKAFVDAVAASIALIKREVPFLAYRRGMQGRRYLQEYFAGQIDDRRGSQGRDMFTRFCNATTPEGERFSDDDIVSHMIFLLMAAHDTTTSSISSLVWALAQNPEWQERVREEVTAVVGDSLDYDERDTLPVTDLCFQEALRLYPPVPFIGRRALDASVVGGLELQANTGVTVSSLITHFLDEFWTQPSTYDPERFSAQRAEHKQHSHLYFPFGGGAHMCIGLHFAGLQVKAFLVQFLRRFRVRLAQGFADRMVPIPIPHPKHGLSVVLERLE